MHTLKKAVGQTIEIIYLKGEKIKMTNKNFIIGYDIFNEIQDVSKKLLDDELESYYHISRALAEKELDDSVENYQDEDDYNEAVDSELNNIININRISTEGLLYRALMKFFNKDKTHNLNGYQLAFHDNVRSVVFDGDYMYWVTGCGYDTISSDLLGGDADGTKRLEFLEWLNS